MKEGINNAEVQPRRNFTAAFGIGRKKYQALKWRKVKIEKEYNELLRDMCEQKLAPNFPYVKSLFMGWFEPIRNMIAGEQEVSRAGKRKAPYAKFSGQFEPYFAIRSVVSLPLKPRYLKMELTKRILFDERMKEIKLIAGKVSIDEEEL